jgi:5S rRNA maturation endonuclease (ribonuclease M5)
MPDRRNIAKPKGTYDLEALEELISELLDASLRGAAIIVEGRRDFESLRVLGAKGPIILASQKPVLALAEEASRKYQEIIVLTDWDKKGDEMAYNIKTCLQWSESKWDTEIRSKLKRLVKKDIKDVESLSKYVERVREEYVRHFELH